MIPQLTSVTATGKYTLNLLFADGLAGTLDLSDLAGKGVFKIWDEDDLFFHPYISETGSISWNEQVDIDATNAYLKIKGISFDDWRHRSLQYATD
ncbi:DUF2442 domain-containing protein [Spirosoma rhododendri]|uniref:DUF2442 domain-containing protein n=1 Tax=Spirosoma rhododendri TaxID=2728024 RepID=A0A7L5DPT1_9BACT|nr:DUF2442 domain-containing protein [Spirosoma rhododendri]QJD78047.1 DUF2442 domain-containing protein [Spirosoma rhododendri]